MIYTVLNRVFPGGVYIASDSTDPATFIGCTDCTGVVQNDVFDNRIIANGSKQTNVGGIRGNCQVLDCIITAVIGSAERRGNANRRKLYAGHVDFGSLFPMLPSKARRILVIFRAELQQ